MKPFTARERLARVRTHVQLASHRDTWEKELEDKIRKRTAELAASVDALAEEIKRRVVTERELESQLRRLRLLDHITRGTRLRA